MLLIFLNVCPISLIMKYEKLTSLFLIATLFAFLATSCKLSDNSIKGSFSGGTGGGPSEDVLPAWYHPQTLSDNISPDGEGAYYAKTAMDEQGNIIIVWSQRDLFGDYQIFKSEYRNGAWVHPSSLSDNISPDGEAAWHPRVAMNNSGVAIITWHQSNGAHSQIFKSEYRNGVWTHPADLNDNISPDGQSAQMPWVAMDDSNNAIITWEQSDSTHMQIFKSEYRNGAWVHPIGLGDNISPNGQIANDSSVAMNNNGTAIIVWKQLDGVAGSRNQIFKSEYRSGIWTHPSSLIDNISIDGWHAYSPQLALSENEDAVITWYQSDGASFQIFKSEYRSGVWTHPSGLADNISPDGQAAGPSHVAIDNNGNSIIVWVQSDGANNQVFKSEYRSGTWTHPTGLADNISPDGTAVVYYPYVNMNKTGTKILIYWDQLGSTYTRILKSEYTNNSWSHPQSVDLDAISPDGSDAYIDLSLGAISNNGNSILLWWQLDGSDDQIFMSHYR